MTVYSTMYCLYRVSQHNMGNFDWLLQVQKGKYAEPFKKKYPRKNDSIYEVKLDTLIVRDPLRGSYLNF